MWIWLVRWRVPGLFEGQFPRQFLDIQSIGDWHILPASPPHALYTTTDTFFQLGKVLVHLLNFFSNELILQFFIQLSLGDILAFNSRGASLSERGALFFNLSNLINQLIDFLYDLDLFQNRGILKVFVDKCQLTFGLGQFTLQAL